MMFRWYRSRYLAPPPIGRITILGIGLIMLGMGFVLPTLAGGVSLPPASAQKIPSTVGTAVPSPVDPSAVAPALPPSAPVP